MLLLFFTGWTTLTTFVLLYLLISHSTCQPVPSALHMTNILTELFWNIIFLDPQWILFSCVVVQLDFSGNSLFAFVVEGKGETENACQCQFSIRRKELHWGKWAKIKMKVQGSLRIWTTPACKSTCVLLSLTSRAFPFSVHPLSPFAEHHG